MADSTITELTRALSTNTGAIIPITIAGVTYGIPVSAVITAQGDMGSGYFQLPTGTASNRPANPNPGTIRWNSSLSAIESFNGSFWSGDRLSVDVLVVGAGGGGGVNSGGGGGGGAVIVASTQLSTNANFNVIVGAGGARGVDQINYGATVAGQGGFSSFNNIVATGGGGGGGYQNASGGSGSNGGGGADQIGPGGIGVAPSLPVGVTGTVYAGFKGSSGVGGSHQAGGGGGAGGSAITTLNGANGIAVNFEGIQYYYGGGGGGGAWRYAAGNGGLGGGGGGMAAYSGGPAGNGGTGGKNNGGNGIFSSNTVATGNGGANTGGGGGGGTFYGASGATGGLGGSGIVQVRYLGTQRANGGNRIFQATIGDNLYTIHEFTSVGAAIFAT